jgi:putative ABC transport system permease protein
MNNGHVKSRSGPGSLFWRLWLRALTVKRLQAGLAIGSLLVGAAVASMLLNLYGDVQRKMTREFRAYGANAVVAPAALPGNAEGAENLMDEGMLKQLDPFRQRIHGLEAVPLLNVVARLRRGPLDPRLPEFQNVVAVGADFSALRRLSPAWKIQGPASSRPLSSDQCVIGSHVASRLRVQVGDSVELEKILEEGREAPPHTAAFRVSAILSSGASEDDQVFVSLASLQALAGLEGKISLVELSIPGETEEIERAAHDLSAALEGAGVRPIRQIVYSQGKVLHTVRGLLASLTALILAIVALCVMATMTAIVLDRRKDIAVMKALGASDRLVMRLFLAEGAGLGLLGGLAGFGLGYFLARDLGLRLFAVALNPAWWAFPVVCLLSVGLAVAATLLPVRVVRSVQPATTLKGE